MTETLQQPESITLNDLQQLTQIVDLASTRGAFRASELKAVGEVYDKVEGFLAFVRQQQEQAKQATEQEGDTEVTNTTLDGGNA